MSNKVLLFRGIVPFAAALLLLACAAAISERGVGGQRAMSDEEFVTSIKRKIDYGVTEKDALDDIESARGKVVKWSGNITQIWNEKIHILGVEDLVILLGLLGLEGTIINTEENFIKEFNDLIKKPSIGMIVIAMPLNDDLTNILIDFKINNKEPFIFILPDVFQPHIEEEGKIVDKILEAIGDIIYT